MIFAIIEDGIVVNKIVADDKFIEDHQLNAVNVDDIDVQIDATYINGKFTNPAPIIGRKIWEQSDPSTDSTVNP
jgi:hypothetical protein